MYLLIALLACGGDDTTQPTDAPQIEANAGTNITADTPQNTQVGGQGQGGDQPQGQPGMGQNPGSQNGSEGQMGGPGADMNAPNNGENIGAAVPPEDGENIGDPNIPPDTINQTVGKDGQTPPQPMDMGNADGGQQEPKKKPPTFIFNAQSDDSGPLYKTADGSCFVRKDWDQPNNGTMGDTEARDCPPQMSSDAWKNCPNGRLVKHNVGDKEGTCECQPIERGEAKVIDCP
jgi:hypothetical protein